MSRMQGLSKQTRHESRAVMVDLIWFAIRTGSTAGWGKHGGEQVLRGDAFGDARLALLDKALLRLVALKQVARPGVLGELERGVLERVP